MHWGCHPLLLLCLFVCLYMLVWRRGGESLLLLELLEYLLLHALHGLPQPCLHRVEFRHHQTQLAQHVVEVVVNFRHPATITSDQMLVPSQGIFYSCNTLLHDLEANLPPFPKVLLPHTPTHSQNHKNKHTQKHNNKHENELKY